MRSILKILMNRRAHGMLMNASIERCVQRSRLSAVKCIARRSHLSEEECIFIKGSLKGANGKWNRVSFACEAVSITKYAGPSG